MGCVCHVLSCIIVQGLYFVNWFLCLNQFIRELNVDQSESSAFSEALWIPSWDLISKINTHTLTNSVWQTKRAPRPPLLLPPSTLVLSPSSRRSYGVASSGGPCSPSSLPPWCWWPPCWVQRCPGQTANPSDPYIQLWQWVWWLWRWCSVLEK